MKKIVTVLLLGCVASSHTLLANASPQETSVNATGVDALTAGQGDADALWWFHTYQVKRGDSLGEIAERNVIAGVSAQTLADALYRKNPQAFIDGDVDRLIQGYRLVMPDARELRDAANTAGDPFGEELFPQHSEVSLQRLRHPGDYQPYEPDVDEFIQWAYPPPDVAAPITINAASAAHQSSPASIAIDPSVHTAQPGEFTAMADAQVLPVTSVASAAVTPSMADAHWQQPTSGAQQQQWLSRVEDYYIGAPRNTGGALTAINRADAQRMDPLNYLIEWRFAQPATVGAALQLLSSYIGYVLVGEAPVVMGIYKRPLPAMQQSVSGITAQEGFDLLAGRGLLTVFDHINRTVSHVPRRTHTTLAELARCPDDVVSATRVSTDSTLVFELADGTRCVY